MVHTVYDEHNISMHCIYRERMWIILQHPCFKTMLSFFMSAHPSAHRESATCSTQLPQYISCHLIYYISLCWPIQFWCLSFIWQQRMSWIDSLTNVSSFNEGPSTAICTTLYITKSWKVWLCDHKMWLLYCTTKHIVCMLFLSIFNVNIKTLRPQDAWKAAALEKRCMWLLFWWSGAL